MTQKLYEGDMITCYDVHDFYSCKYSRGSNLLVAKLFYYTYLGVQKLFYEGC